MTGNINNSESDMIIVSEQTIQDCIEFIKDHIAHFGCVPMEFEGECGNILPYDKVWSIAENNNLTKLI